jgi:hypothetical protein
MQPMKTFTLPVDGTARSRSPTAALEADGASHLRGCDAAHLDVGGQTDAHVLAAGRFCFCSSRSAA